MGKKHGNTRIIFVFKSVGKPVYWLFVSLLLLLLRSAHSVHRIGHHIGEGILSVAHMLPRLVSAVHRALHRTSTTSKKKKISHPKIQTKKTRPQPTVPRPFFVRHWLFFTTMLLLIAASTASAYAFYTLILKDLPKPEQLIAHRPALTTKIYDRNHELLYKIYKDENRSLIKVSELPTHFIDATIAIEDKEFYSHKGFSLRGISRALRSTFVDGKVQGGSTITQQLVKNILLTRERTLTRKLKEVILAMQVESALSKETILEMYVNDVSYGGSVYGIEEAAQRYFGISARDLTLAQSTFLAALPAAPSTYTPCGPYPELAVARQHEVLRRMVEDGKISSEDAEAAKQEVLVFNRQPTDIKAPHFVMYIRDYLAKLYGEALVSQGGLEVITTLDLALQETTQQAVSQEVEKLKSLKVSNGASLVTNPKTGEILAMVGSREYFDTENDGQVNVTLRPRQPGSSIKPLMYATALERGYTPATIIDDSPVVYSIPGSPPYAPKNYDGTFHGKETLRLALANSHNVPAVKTEAAIGLTPFITKARALGITTWTNTSRFGLSLTLGGGEVLMTDMATAYGAFANQGERVDLNPVIEIRTATGELLYHNDCINALLPCHGKRVLDERIAYQMTNILSDNNARAQAFGQNSVLFIPGQEVAVKTGTTNGLRDNWTIGYTSDRLVATWVGNNDNSQMSRVTSGITGASPIWNTIMRTLLDPQVPHRFPIPGNMVAVSVCAYSGHLSCNSACSRSYTEYFIPGTEPTTCAPSDTANQPQTSPTPQAGQRKRITRDRILDGISTQE